MTRRKSEQTVERTTRPPATTPQDRENQLVSAAVDLAEQQILAGTASAQVITHYLKLGSSREKLEQQKIAMENKLLVTKEEMLQSEKRIEDLYREALTAMSSYQGNPPEATENDVDFDD